MNRQGYIKISRGINTHWLWQDAERLKWWLDLLLLANWEDKKQLVGKQLIEVKRGQMIACVGFLIKRWRRSRSMIEPFLEMLVSEGMIRKSMSHNISVIEIVKYDEYQDIPYTQAQDKKDAHLTNLQSSTYEESDTHLDTNLNAHLESTNKLNKINKYISSTNTREQERDVLSKDFNYAEIMCMRYHLTREQYTKVVEDFFTECDCNWVEKNDSVADLKSHFNNWLRIKQTRQDNGKQDGKYAQRKPTTAKVGSRAEYEGAF